MRDFCDITVILDRSGSMRSVQEATVAGFNRFVREQKAVPGDGCWSLMQFDDQYETVYSCKPQDAVPLLAAETFVPRGSTALVDAICRTIHQTGIRLAAMLESERPNKVLMVILTDGVENASREYKPPQMADMIAHQRERYNWTFLFLAANQDAIATAAQYGIPRGSALTYAANNAGTHAAFTSASGATRSWKLDGNDSAQELFTDEDRNAASVQVNVNVAQTAGTP